MWATGYVRKVFKQFWFQKRSIFCPFLSEIKFFFSHSGLTFVPVSFFFFNKELFFSASTWVTLIMAVLKCFHKWKQLRFPVSCGHMLERTVLIDFSLRFCSEIIS